MKSLQSSLVLLSALSATCALAQTKPSAPPKPSTQPAPPPAVRPMPPVPSTPPMTPSMMPGFQQPMQPYRMMLPMGNQAGVLFEIIRTNKDELKVTDAQWKIIQDARDADQKTRMDRSMQTMNIRRDLQTLADADAPEIAKIDAKVRELKKAEGDDMMSDFSLTAAYRKALTPEQREKSKTLFPKFEPYMPMPGRPGMPGGPPMPGGPGMMPGGNPPGAMGTPGGPPMMAPPPPGPNNPPRP